MQKICSKTQEITNFTKINCAIYYFYANFFHEKLEVSSESLNSFLKDTSIPSQSETQKQKCEEKLNQMDIYESMINFDNNTSPGNDGLKDTFIRHFGKMLKTSFST